MNWVWERYARRRAGEKAGAAFVCRRGLFELEFKFAAAVNARCNRSFRPRLRTGGEKNNLCSLALLEEAGLRL